MNSPSSEFQCSSASRKFLNVAGVREHQRHRDCFSALQRAENFSIARVEGDMQGDQRFQCSSASRKFLNLNETVYVVLSRVSFSALQRAENFSIRDALHVGLYGTRFQCSSASRKFLNQAPLCRVGRAARFQCSSASRKFLNASRTASERCATCAFQCSSASRKFLNLVPRPAASTCTSVSVLFSEPKISQFENVFAVRLDEQRLFQCSSASRKFLNGARGMRRMWEK